LVLAEAIVAVANDNRQGVVTGVLEICERLEEPSMPSGLRLTGQFEDVKSVLPRDLYFRPHDGPGVAGSCGRGLTDDIRHTWLFALDLHV